MKRSLLAAVAFLSTSISALHYERPPCGSDERAVQLMGIEGVFCSPECNPDCPSDAPDGVTATPQCALQSPSGEKYCAILCSPSLLEGGDCGPDMNCEDIPGSGGIGVCTYPLSATGLRSDRGTTLVALKDAVVRNE
eukprot:CAMPEP_0201121822 /NCGR_PEP_ID=MMETSP0850-20130426/5616_1 /ASSEMBLY_ACC=CAM_ASM_000622 /TAXON_ID=183588 /ORGANISM="Pseudo-nitzschia fraudulenta, Strain WWA7" /LENGTH=136 /DNA_ID=CAMNT_0047388377 /DNA_START=75 /DNA_END=485 /DNA_ORIENTATION=-